MWRILTIYICQKTCTLNIPRGKTFLRKYKSLNKYLVQIYEYVFVWWFLILKMEVKYFSMRKMNKKFVFVKHSKSLCHCKVDDELATGFSFGAHHWCLFVSQSQNSFWFYSTLSMECTNPISIFVFSYIFLWNDSFFNIGFVAQWYTGRKQHS